MNESGMRVWRDGIATLLVFAAGLLYILWVTDSAFTGLSTRTVSVLVFVLGFAGCITSGRLDAVYGTDKEARPAMPYVVTASVVGFVAFVAGILAMILGTAWMLATLVVAMGLLWVMATSLHRTDILSRPHHRELHKVA